jgi:hypothetical protein
MNEDLIVCLDDQVGDDPSSLNISSTLLAECGISWGTIKFNDMISNNWTDVSYSKLLNFSTDK